MKTITRWRKAKVFKFTQKREFDGVVRGNMGIIRIGGLTLTPWEIVHIPSGRGIGYSRLRKTCKKIADFVEQQGADYLDRYAAKTATEGDYKKYRDLRNYQETLE